MSFIFELGYIDILLTIGRHGILNRSNAVGVGQQALIYMWTDYTIQGNQISNKLQI
jgi:hypothetical protein